MVHELPRYHRLERKREREREMRDNGKEMKCIAILDQTESSSSLRAEGDVEG